MNRANEYKRLLHLEPGAQRPTPLARVTNTMSRLHPLPRQPVFKEIDVTMTGFFGVPEFNKQDLKHFAKLEDGWPVRCLPSNVHDGGSLRLFVWAEKRPTPATHFEQCLIRLPVIGHAPGARAFFTEFARAQHELYDGERTNRCPLCGSQLLGFHMWDHGVEQCPFNILEGEDRVEFIAVNSISFCQDCNSRSATHPLTRCTPKTCAECRKPGHTSALLLCDHPLGQPDEQSRRDLKTMVDQKRRSALYRIQRLLRSPDNPLMYRSHVDSPYETLRGRLIQEHNIQHQGWGIYVDEESDFEQTDIRYYLNNRIGEMDNYPTMIPPELDDKHQEVIPRFEAEVSAYLNIIGDMVTELRIDPTIFDNMVLPQFPLRRRQEPQARQQVNPLPPTPRRDARGFGFAAFSQSRPRMDYVMPSVNHHGPAPSSSSARRISQSSDRHVEDSGSASTSRTTPYSQSKSAKDREERELEKAMKASLISEQKERQPSTSKVSQPLPEIPPTQDKIPTTSASLNQSSASLNLKSAQLEDTQNLSRQPSTETLTPEIKGTSSASISPENEIPKDQDPHGLEMDMETSEAEAEMLICGRAKTWCREPLRIRDRPARNSFQHKSYEILIENALPEGKPAAIERAQTLLFVLTGQTDSRTGIYKIRSVTTIRKYARFLMDIGQLLSQQALLIVQFEPEDIWKTCSKTGAGSEVLYIPSISFFEEDMVSAWLKDLKNDQIRCFDKFPIVPKRRRWFTTEIYDHYEISERDQGIQENELVKQYDNKWPENYEFPIEVLQLIYSYKQPTASGPAFCRFIWLVPYLTGSDRNLQLEISRGDEATQLYYMYLIKAAIKVLITIRSNPKRTVKVIRSRCLEDLATLIARGHELVLPTFPLFMQHSWERWQAWLEKGWDQLVDELAERNICRCTHPKGYEDQLPAVDGHKK